MFCFAKELEVRLKLYSDDLAIYCDVTDRTGSDDYTDERDVIFIDDLVGNKVGSTNNHAKQSQKLYSIVPDCSARSIVPLYSPKILLI